MIVDPDVDEASTTLLGGTVVNHGKDKTEMIRYLGTLDVPDGACRWTGKIHGRIHARVKQDSIERGLAVKHLADGCVVLYDLTSTYFERRQCPLAKRGYSRDGKRGKLQINFGLLCTADGCPVSVEVFKGNTGDPTTLKSQVTALRERFGLKRFILVGDRGMITNARIREDLRGVEGVDWITCLRTEQIRDLVKKDAIQARLFDELNFAEIESPDFPGERLIVC